MKILKKVFINTLVFISVNLLFASVLNAGTYDFKIDGGTTKDLIPQQRPFAGLFPNYDPQAVYGKNHLTVTAWVDHKSKRNVAPVYYLGDSVKFFVKANKDCYITLLDIGTTGKTHVIFPNDFQRTNFVKAGQVLAIPHQVKDNFDFKVTGKRGNEVVKVIATMERENIIPEAYLKKVGPYRQINTKDISVVATGIGSSLENEEWAEYTKILRIR